MVAVLYISGCFNSCNRYALALVNADPPFCVYFFCIGDGHRLKTKWIEFERFCRKYIAEKCRLMGRHFFLVLFVSDLVILYPPALLHHFHRIGTH